MMEITVNRFRCVLFILLVSAVSNVIAGTYYVATNGSDTNPGTKDLPWATIQKAANTMGPGDTVYVEAGTYNNFPGVSIYTSGTESSSITYDANGTVILDGNNAAVDAFLISGASWIVIDGFTIRNFDGDKKCGVHLKAGASHCTVQNCEIYNITGGGGTGVANGIRILNSSYNTISNNYCHNNYGGIGLRSYPDDQSHETKNNLIVGNETSFSDVVPENGDGIAASDWWIHDNTFRGNIVHHNDDDGIDLWQSHNNIVEKNIAYANGNGTGGDGNGYKLGSKGTNPNGISGGHIVRYNIAYGNLKAGFISNGRSNTYYNNVAYNNGTYGFYDEKLAGETGSSFRNNTATGNVTADLSTWAPVTANYNNWSMPGAFRVNYNGTLYTSLTSYQAACGQEGNSMNTDPCFVDDSNADFHLTADSPLIDAGNLIETGLTDRDGIAVPQSYAPDIGAYEYRQIGDFYGGCDVDFYDFAILASSWRLQEGQTGYNSNCDISTPADGIIDEKDLEVFVDNWLAGK
jgi:parallel beta-helix repeat protein